jgi:hypothetical protein
MSLDEYAVSDEARSMHDQQVRLLAGRREEGEPEDPLARAKLHLERFAFVGLLERFDESMLLCGIRLGWRNVHYVKANVNRHKPADAISPAARAAIVARSGRDVELYRWAAERFAAALAARPITDSELRTFAAVCRVYTLAARIVRLPQALAADARTARWRRAIARS